MDRQAPQTAWDIEALEVAEQHKLSMRDARNYVILARLKQGDTRPYSDWTIAGHVPSRGVLIALAVMMARGDSPRFDASGSDDAELREVADIFRLSLKVTGKGKRTPDPNNITRDRRLALEVLKLISIENKSYEEALDIVTDWWKGEGESRDSVEKAYKAYKNFYGTNSGASVP